MIQITCPTCQAVLAFDEDMAGHVVTCPDCDAKVPIPPSLDERDSVYVRLRGHGKWVLAELMAIPVVVDGRQVGEGSIKRGFDIVVKTTVGFHTVKIGPASHTLELARKGLYEVDFEFSRAWGKYSLPPKVQRVNTADSEDWPTAQDDVEPIELMDVAGGVTPQDQAVLDELAKLQTQKPGWLGTSALLLISLLLYIGAAQAQQIWDSVFILIPVLFFHELGHYLAMRIFGYQNLRMFFIPFFGAAVSGRHYNIAGWKKAVVALAGPLPGIAVGAFVGMVGLILDDAAVTNAAMLTLYVNGFNLLPFLPLDGGWVVHAVLFVRHPVLDVVFRVLAALCLVGLAFLPGGWCFGVLALMMLIAAPVAFRLARITERLKSEGLVARSVDNHSIPDEAALQILAEVRRAVPQQTNAKMLAQNVANVFEMFNAEPPGVFASLGLLVLHAGGFVLALVMVVVITFFQLRPG